VANDTNLRNASQSRISVTYQYWAAKILSKSRPLRSRLANAGDIADYLSWGSDHFGTFPVFAKREELWEAMVIRAGSRPVRGIEFGVAWGYGTGWWLRRVRDERLRWDGFDRFTGLPRGWRDLREGHFDAQGQPPAIDDSRVTWHVGDVQDRLPDLDLARNGDQLLVVLFDLDVYEPSAFAWEHIRRSLRPGDLLYFDEAFDADERHLLDHFVLPSGRFDLVGATPLALALAVVEINTEA